jgi:hypothetical protein
MVIEEKYINVPKLCFSPGNETRAMRKSDTRRIRAAHKKILRSVFGVTLEDVTKGIKTSSKLQSTNMTDGTKIKNYKLTGDNLQKVCKQTGFIKWYSYTFPQEIERQKNVRIDVKINLTFESNDKLQRAQFLQMKKGRKKRKEKKKKKEAAKTKEEERPEE